MAYSSARFDWSPQIVWQQSGCARPAKRLAELTDVPEQGSNDTTGEFYATDVCIRRDLERAVLFGEAVPDANGQALSVYRDEKGSAVFRGQKAQALGVARQAIMDAAKLLGLVIDKQQLSVQMEEEAARVAAEFGLDDVARAKLLDFARRKRPA